MASPTVNFTIVNGGLGNSPPSPSSTVCIVGCSSSGTANVVSGPYASPSQLVSDYGYGPGTELAAACIQAGLQPLFIKTPSTTPGSSGAVTHVGTGLSVMTVSVGAAYDRFNVLITTTRSGTVGTDPEPGFTYSLDGGLTTSQEVRMPVGGSYVIPNTGLTLSFTVATIVAGDTYAFTTTAPAWGNSDITAAIAALRVSTKLAGLVHVVGPMNATAAGVYNTALGLFLAAKKPIRASAETIDIASTEATWITTIENDFATYTSQLISMCAGPMLLPSAISGVNFRRSCGSAYIMRLGQIAISQSAGEVDLGAIPNVTTVYHDEATVPGLDADRFVTLTSIPGLIGYYFTRSNLMYSVGSDFTEMQYGRIMDEAVRITYAYFVQRLNSRVRLNRTTGFILEKDARALESGNNAKLEQGLVNTGNASSAETIVSRTDNISSTKTLTVTVKILPPGYIQTVNVTMTFTNPALGS